MSKSRLFLLTALAVATILTVSSNQAQADNLIVNWNFNSLVDNAPNPLTYAPDVGMGLLTIDNSWQTSNVGPSYGVTSYTGTAFNSYMGAPAGQALALQGGNNNGGTPNNGKWMMIQADLNDYINPILSLAMFRSFNTPGGFNSNQLSWSIDGTNFTDFGNAFDPGATFAIQTFDLSSINDLDGASTAYFRITFDGATTSDGHNRIDNIQLNATSTVPEPLGMTGLLLISALSITRRRRV